MQKIEIKNSYNILFGELCVALQSNESAPFFELKNYKKILIITNTKISSLHLGALISALKNAYLHANSNLAEIYTITLQDGECYKDFSAIEQILEAAFSQKLDRKSLFVAFGGGVVGDITGFAAGIFMRGVDFIQVPTTLLSQVDSSVGGKVGINNKFGKNLVGLFKQPKAVFIDPSFLETLPEREISAGLAEIVKMAVCFKREFFNELKELDFAEFTKLIAQKSPKVAQIISKAVSIKAEVVEIDPYERGIRAALNYGHTFGHAIEKECGYGSILHGEAVAMGMIMANTLARDLGLLSDLECEEIESCLKRFNLPIKYKIKNIESFYNSFFSDKKTENSKVKFILPRGIGGVEFRDDISQSAINAILERYL